MKQYNLGLSITILVFFVSTGHAKDDGVCDTEACKEIANIFLKNMNASVDPCDDFYQYACGNFIKNAKFPNGDKKIEYFSILQNEIYEKLNQTLNTTITNQDSKPLRLVKKFYQTCMTSENYESKDKEEIAKIINSLGGWPTLDGLNGFKWNETLFDWQNMTQKLRQLNYVPYLFVEPLYTEMNRTILHVSISESSNNQSKFMESMGVNKTRFENDEAELKKLRIKLSQLKYKLKDDADLTIRELQKKILGFRWLEFLKAEASFPVNESESIYVHYPDVILNVTQIFAQQPKRTLANYILLHFANIRSAHAYEEDIKKQNPDRKWRRCIMSTEKYLPVAISSVYVREHFRPENQPTNEVHDMFRHLKEQFKDMFQKSTWMDAQFKTYAQDKLNSLELLIAHPKELMDDQKMEEYYKNLEISEDSYFHMKLKIEKFNSNKEASERLKKSWTKHTDFVLVNAFNQESNSITIPASIMQGIFFNKTRPQYMNYGALGNVMAHEIGHSFDYVNSMVNLMGEPWFDTNSSSYLKYTEMVECINEMYDNYVIKGINEKISGGDTTQETFSDFVGLRSSYSAYKKWVEEHEEEKKLPGIDRSSKQLFWLSFANAWCTKYEPEFLRTHIMKDSHPPAEARIVNSLKNMPEFEEDYQCRPESKMIPSKRCPTF